MDPDTIEMLSAKTCKRLERARMIEIDLRAGFPQLPIKSSSLPQTDIIKIFSSPFPDVHEFDY